MSKILKAATVKIDENNRVSVNVLDTAALTEMQDKKNEQGKNESQPPEDTARSIIGAAEEKAKRIIAEAEEESRRLAEDKRAECEAELINLKDETLKNAFDEGYDKGYEETKIIRAKSDEILNGAYKERENIFKNMEPELVDLVSELVNKLIHDTADIRPELISYLIRQGLDTANAPGDVLIHVSESDYDEAVKHKNEYLTGVDMGSRVDIIKDASLNKSDCVIETTYGNIDCSLNTQYASLKDSIYYILHNAESGIDS